MFWQWQREISRKFVLCCVSGYDDLIETTTQVFFKRVYSFYPQIRISLLFSRLADLRDLTSITKFKYLEEISSLVLKLRIFCFLGTAVKCPSLSVPSNGILQGCEGNKTEDYLTTCRFSCSAGYIGSGSEFRICLKNSSWSGQNFSCQGILEVF